MLKILFSLLICVLGHSSNLDNVIKENLGENVRVNSSVTNQALPVSPIKLLSRKTGIYKEDKYKNFYNFPGYNEGAILSKMQDSLLYVLVPMDESSDYIEKLIDSINKSIKELPEGCKVYSIFVIDDVEGLDRENDIHTLMKGIQNTQILSRNYKVFYNLKKQGSDRTKRILLERMVEVNDKEYKDANRSTYFVFLEPESVINKFTFKVFLSAAFLNEDKWAFDFSYCIRHFNEASKSEIALATELSLKDFCYRYYANDVLQEDVDDLGYKNFDEHGFLKTDRFNAIWGYSPVLYKYDKTRVKKCEPVLLGQIGEVFKYFSSAYVFNEGLDQFDTIVDYKFYLKYVIPAGYFAVFPRGFGEIAEERRARCDLYYYGQYGKKTISNNREAIKRHRENQDNTNALMDNLEKRRCPNEDESNKIDKEKHYDTLSVNYNYTFS